MRVPKTMREQMRIYEREGFVLDRLEQVNASHFKAFFVGVPQIQFLTAHTGDPRSIRNNIARMRRSRDEKRQGEVAEQNGSASCTIHDAVHYAGRIRNRNG